MEEGSGIRKHDVPRVFTGVALNVVGHEFAYKYFKSNLGKIKT